MSSKSSKNGAYNMLIAQKDSITKITGIITPESINNDLKNELGGGIHHLEVHPFCQGIALRLSSQRDTSGKVSDCHL
jgi:hypothetical protein